MKKTFVFAAAAALLSLASCNKELPVASGIEPERASLSVSLVGTATRATGSVNTTTPEYQTADEQKINNLQVFVFNGDSRDGYASVDNKDNAEVACTAGTRDVVCLVNAPATLGSVVTKTGLMAAVSELKANASSFEMVGVKEAQAISSEGTNDIQVPVKRIAAKIVLKGIENQMKSGQDIKVVGVFVSNVAAQINYGLDQYAGAESLWYNKGGYRSAANLGAFTNDMGLTATVANGAKYSTNHYFYAYPNNYAQANYAETWTPKRTMLVIMIEHLGEQYDYPIDLGVDLASNKMYVINNLKLTNLGNKDDGGEGGKDEEDPIVTSTSKFTVDVLDWDVVLLGTAGEITI